MRIALTTFVFLIMGMMVTSSGCLDDEKKEKEYFSETYNKIFLNFKIESNEMNNTSYIIIPAPIQNGKTLELSAYQNMTEFHNYSYDYIDTEYGQGIKISPIPSGQFWIWFSCEPYTVTGPFDIKQNVQFYKTGYPGLSTWETDGVSGYYWFFASVNVTGLSFKFEYSDCYFFFDMGMMKNIDLSGWIKVKFEKIQEDMEM
ncbi:MAG: hypothetical protein QGH39_00685 [Candidatus Thermoplasmatota archaeon]|jgi:hypothetical protein|nr:hypothetical protein [Candidatus Thermoplasmatota archaeon]MDP7264058.1 hypothetical protein [Candidatus Thermoplasmatota archaeon]